MKKATKTKQPAHATGKVTGRRKAAKQKGLTYERKVVKYLKKLIGEARVIYGQWFYFIDENGGGYCQPDILIDAGKYIIICECKLTQTIKAEMQIEHLYSPVVEVVFGKPTVWVQVCKNIKHPPKRKINSIESILKQQLKGHWTWQFLA